jgi:hypothetical protein
MLRTHRTLPPPASFDDARRRGSANSVRTLARVIPRRGDMHRQAWAEHVPASLDKPDVGGTELEHAGGGCARPTYMAEGGLPARLILLQQFPY